MIDKYYIGIIIIGVIILIEATPQPQNGLPNRYDWYSRICLAATVLAITGMYCYNLYLIVGAALITSACIIDSWRR